MKERKIYKQWKKNRKSKTRKNEKINKLTKKFLFCRELLISLFFQDVVGPVQWSFKSLKSQKEEDMEPRR